MLFKRNKYKSKNDEELLILYKTSLDKRVIGELYSRYGHLVYGLCLKLLQNKAEAEDKTMVIFESLYNKVLKHEISNFKSWLYTVVKNECYMQLRKKNIGHGDLSSDNIAEDNSDIEHIYLKEVQLTHLEEALKMLKPEQFKAIKLFYLEERSYKEICEILNWDLNKVKSQIQNAKRNLKLLLEGNHVDQSTS